MASSMYIHDSVPTGKHEIVIILNILDKGLGSDWDASQMSKVKLSINHFTNGFALQVTLEHYIKQMVLALSLKE